MTDPTTDRTPLGAQRGREGVERDALALLVAHHPGDSWTQALRPDDCTNCRRAVAAADRLLAAGYRLVRDDEETVERVARAIWWAGDPVLANVSDQPVDEELWQRVRDTPLGKRAWNRARAALAALRGGE